MRTSIQHALLSFAALIVAVPLVTGCNLEVEAPRDTGPSYAELVVTYNAELAALDRLEEKREELIEKYESKLRPSPEKALDALSGVLSATEQSEDLPDSDEALDPNAMLDKAVENAQSAHDVAGQLLDSLAGTAVDEEEAEALSKQLEAELNAIDKEIEEQKERVRRAREARDAAEANQK